MTVTLTEAPDAPAQGASGGAGEPAGILGAPPATLAVLNVPPARQYDLIADLLDAALLSEFMEYYMRATYPNTPLSD